MLISLCLLFWSFDASYGTKLNNVEAFIEDLIKMWQLRSPTIVINDELPNLCINHQWLLCLQNEVDSVEVLHHMEIIQQGRKLDSLIFVGIQGHGNILKQLSVGATNFLISNIPAFIPISYRNNIKLRLDSNIIFYAENDGGNFELYDIFAVKGGPSIELELGNWTHDNGMRLLNTKNRWERRTNLKQSTFINCMANNPGWAEFIRDKNGWIIGSKGYIPNMLFYITDMLNLTNVVIEAPWEMKLLANGSWTSTIGLLQRREADVITSGIGVNLQRSYAIDHPIPTHTVTITLIAAAPKGKGPNMWVYVSVFGVYQWMIFIILLVVMVMGFSIINAVSEDQSGREFGTKRGCNKNYKLNSSSSALSMVCLYAIQMGSHTNSKQLAPRLLTFTMSILTWLVFAFYTTDITAEMTSGPPIIPIRTFEDVLHYDYKVIARTSYDERFLASSKPGSARLEVYKKNFEKKSNLHEILQAVIHDPNAKTLFYAPRSTLISQNSTDKMLKDQVFALEMDDSVKAMVGLALQKDSEFLQIFNHYILKGWFFFPIYFWYSAISFHRIGSWRVQEAVS